MYLKRVHHFRCYPSKNHLIVLENWIKQLKEISQGSIKYIIPLNVRGSEGRELLKTYIEENFNIDDLPERSIKSVIGQLGNWDYEVLFKNFTIDGSGVNRKISVDSLKEMKFKLHRFHKTVKFEDVKIDGGSFYNRNGKWYVQLKMKYHVDDAPVQKPPLSITIIGHSLQLSDGTIIIMPPEITRFYFKHIAKKVNKEKRSILFEKQRNRIRHWMHHTLNEIMKTNTITKIEKRGKSVLKLEDFVAKIKP